MPAITETVAIVGIYFLNFQVQRLLSRFRCFDNSTPLLTVVASEVCMMITLIIIIAIVVITVIYRKEMHYDIHNYHHHWHDSRQYYNYIIS